MQLFNQHFCEGRFADALRLSAAERREITLHTKCGIVPAEGMFDFSYEHIMTQVEGTRRARSIC